MTRELINSRRLTPYRNRLSNAAKQAMTTVGAILEDAGSTRSKVAKPIAGTAEA